MSLRLTLRQLEIFCAIVQAGSTSGAGKMLALSQSAVSSGLKDLENQLGILLFERVGKRLVSNEQGRLLYIKAVAMLEQAQEIQGLFAGDAGEIHVSASTTIGNYLLPPILATLRQQYPKLTVRLTVANSNDVIEQVAQLECDIGLIEGQCQHPDIATQIWQYDELVWFCASESQWLDGDFQYLPSQYLPQHSSNQNSQISANSAISLAELLQLPLIMREAGSGTRGLMEMSLAQYGLHLTTNHPKNLMELGNSEAIKHSVMYDLGIGCLSQHVLQDVWQTGKLHAICTQEPTIKRPLLLLQHRQKHDSYVLSLFKQQLFTYSDANIFA
ncbi:LysR substrate-binding domain-containing protein [Psychrobacter sp. I-STPA6b]|uniref:LysR substrate-binding domain-containing protein n=1 Tax=Psychrobacter sp. I-STPA6b TaxID=2585718 RepID=UPI001D0C6CCA|nr:LysR substrate-binding domain-containing protein [Psychrobacter sp. I-STPA6b]